MILDDLSQCLRRIPFLRGILLDGAASCPRSVVSSTRLRQIGVTNLILESAKDSGRYPDGFPDVGEPRCEVGSLRNEARDRAGWV